MRTLCAMADRSISAQALGSRSFMREFSAAYGHQPTVAILALVQFVARQDFELAEAALLVRANGARVPRLAVKHDQVRTALVEQEADEQHKRPRADAPVPELRLADKQVDSECVRLRRQAVLVQVGFADGII